jgi:hypothetical protein
MTKKATATGDKGSRKKAISKKSAVEMAGHRIDQQSDSSASDDEKKKRKRRLLKGPMEFRGIREDQKKRKK